MTRATPVSQLRPAPRIYQLSSAAVAASGTFAKLLARISAMNFDVLYVLPGKQADATELAITPRLIAAAASAGLDILLDLDVAKLGNRYDEVLSNYLTLGVRGIRLSSAWTLPGQILRQIIATVHSSAATAFCCADAFGRPQAELLRLCNAGLDYVFNSAEWWDGKAAWLLEQRAALPLGTQDIGFPLNAGSASAALLQHRYLLAASLSDGIMMPAGYEFGGKEPAARESRTDISSFIASINLLKTSLPALAESGPIQALSDPFQAVQGFARQSADGGDLAFIVTNTDDKSPYSIELDWLLASTAGTTDLEDVTPGAPPESLDQPTLLLEPGMTRMIRALAAGHSDGPHVDLLEGADIEQKPSHLVIEAVEPEIDGGRFAVKRIVGDPLHVSADIFRDGHDQIAASIRLREAGETEWRTAPMRLIENDRWAGSITVKRPGRARYTVEAWTDRFESWRLDTLKKRTAGQSLTTDLAEAEMMVVEALERARQSGGRGERRLTAILTSLEQAADENARADIVLAEFTRHAVACFPHKSDHRFYGPWLDLVVDREAARFAAWYEMFPRSQGTIEGKGATFADCTARLPEIQALGFDVLYLVPINPIGRVNRKGRHNSLTAGPDEPGSPYAIGNEAGGHDAIEAALGTLEDFRAFHRAVHDHGMELALDFAVQCAPDHPWVKEHPNWFRRRPDGTIKFAENPPKKYEDIVNLDFDCAEWKDIWHALRDVVLFWVDEGVRIFRIDNPHTKPVPFWEWLITEVKQHDPGVLFLAEAFTRPKMMKRLAKIGFTQSYSYFTWRNTKAELTEYLTELTQGPSRDYMQPNFFANTPDILPFFLQTGGRAGFRIRLALAATLSPVYGIYNGFELCEAAALPGREEYADSEKYTYKVWDWDRPGHIKDDIQRLNRLRRESPALRLFTNLIFAEASNPQVLFYAKISADRRDAVLVVINLDPLTVARTDLTFPFDAMGLDAEGSFETEELFTGERQLWQGPHHTVVLDPAVQPTMILRRIGITGDAQNA